ncbi:hypothetical protein BX661DRAFT_179634, partial [Kickxella alabastrina]|uniref:uncharacterized protein n=1 Tax=Kickxella alabastrina TaxID=61397 RepID=UPI00221E7296
MPFFRRDIALGPEDPNVLAEEMFGKINNKIWVVKTLVYISTVFSGAMVLFLTSVFIWRRSLVNRISLRLIFLICVSDLIQSIFTIRSFTAKTLVKCQVNGFFIDFCVALSVYLSSAIAFNLQMVFLRSSRKPLPKYTEYLYFAVPILASAIHTIPQYAWAIRHDECHPLNPIMPGTKKYLIYIIFVTLLVPAIFVLYNVFTSIRVILTLYFKQRKVSRALNSASFETNRLLKDASDKPTSISKIGSSRLQAVRRVYRACIRIALYPLTPILWWIFNATFYGVQYHITMTYQSDVYTMTVLMYINWVAFPSIVILNFLVFLTDPG